MHEDTRVDTPVASPAISSPLIKSCKHKRGRKAPMSRPLNPTLVRQLVRGFPTWNWLQMEAMNPFSSLKSTDIKPPAKRHPDPPQKIRNCSGRQNRTDGNLSYKPQSSRKNILIEQSFFEHVATTLCANSFLDFS